MPDRPSMRRTLLICDYPPATYAGGPIILRSLFKSFPQQDLFVAAPGYLNRVAEKSGALACKHYDLPAVDPATRFIGRLLKLVNLLLIPACLLRAVKICRKERVEVLFTVPASTVAIVAYLVSKLTRIELYVYVMDDYDESMRHQGLAFRLLNRSVGQKELLKSASKVWAISNYMAEFFKQAFGVDAIALPHSVDVDIQGSPMSCSSEASLARFGACALAATGTLNEPRIERFLLSVLALAARAVIGVVTPSPRSSAR